MLHRDAEAKTFYVVNIRHIFQQRGNDKISAALSDDAAHGIDVGKLGFIVAAGGPFQLIQVHRVGDAEILEGRKQLAVDGLRQADLRSDTVVEVRQNAFAVHTLGCGGQAE